MSTELLRIEISQPEPPPAVTPASLEELLELLARKPHLGPILERAAELDREGLAQRQAQGQIWWGFEADQVPCHAYVLHDLLSRRVLYQGIHSNRRRTFRCLVSQDVIQMAVQQQRRPVPEPAEAGGIPPDLFSVVLEQDYVVGMLKLSIAAARPVHILLSGPTGTAKSLILDELQRLPDHRYCLGSTTTRAGMVSYLLETPCRWLIMDEIEKGQTKELGALLSLMQGGYVGRLNARDRQEVRRLVTVYGACNRPMLLPPELRNRFEIIEIPPYTRAQIGRICEAVLVQQEGEDPELAHLIARRVALSEQGDVRKAQRIARLASGDLRSAERLCAALL